MSHRLLFVALCAVLCHHVAADESSKAAHSARSGKGMSATNATPARRRRRSQRRRRRSDATPVDKAVSMPGNGASKHGQSCTNLLNKDSYFAVKVAVGTPPQEFELVADTGSNAIIVASCICAQQGYCPRATTCFTGGNRSSTFALSSSYDGGRKFDAGPMAVSMTFGSGTITSVVATDIVQVADVQVAMEDGVLLMVDRRKLRITGQFDGILGLGPLDPKSQKVAEEEQQAPKINEVAPKLKTKLFLEEANVDRFSICFNDAGKPGTLRLNVPEFQNSLPAIGTFHWALGLYGISVGSETVGSFACGEKTMKGNQLTPCGVIPDSGTTLMMGPANQITELFGSICERWPRCKAARKNELRNMSASHAFQTLLYHCGDWVTKKEGIDEVPSVFFTMGSPGNLQKIELTSWAYIVETMQDEYTRQTVHLKGVQPFVVDKPTGKKTKVCMPSFGVQEYNTRDNGPVWLFGTPLFYQYTVGYGLKGGNIAIQKQRCGSCNDTSTSLLSNQKQLHGAADEWARPMRTSSTDARVPYVDKSLPL